MKIGDRVVVCAEWSTLHGFKGRVTQVHPVVLVRFEGDHYPIPLIEPIRVDEVSLVLETPEPSMTGSE